VVAATTMTTGTASAPSSTTTAAASPEMAPTAPLESDLPVESELPAESEVEVILPAAAATVITGEAAPSNRRVENALTPQEILRRSVPPERLDV
jgi:hypothetical protein